jgi:uncharacterized protein (TIGR00369 family)
MDGFAGNLGVRRETAEDGHARLEFDAVNEHLNPAGTVHGGVLATLVDTAMGMAARTRTDDGEVPATSQLTIAYLNAGREGLMTVTAQVRKQGARAGVRLRYRSGRQERRARRRDLRVAVGRSWERRCGPARRVKTASSRRPDLAGERRRCSQAIPHDRSPHERQRCRRSCYCISVTAIASERWRIPALPPAGSFSAAADVVRGAIAEPNVSPLPGSDAE